MNKEEIGILDKCVKAPTMMSERLDTVFKATEVLQAHIIKKPNGSVSDQSIALQNVRNINKFEKKFEELDVWKTKLNDMDRILYDRINKLEETVKDNTRRIDRLEEISSYIISCVLYCKSPSFIDDKTKEWLENKKKEMYEEQAAAKGDQDE